MVVGKEISEEYLNMSRKEVQMERIGMAMLYCPRLGHETLVEKKGRVMCLYFDDEKCVRTALHERIHQGFWAGLWRRVRPLPPVECRMLDEVK